jgi:predicted ester cyclase
MGDIEANKRMVRDFYEKVVAGRDIGLLKSLVAEDMFDHGAQEMGWAPGRAGFVEHIEWVHAGVSDIAVTVDDLVAEGHRVVAYWSLSGVHTGDFFVPATQRSFTATAISILTFRDSQLIEYKVQPDALGLLQQLGAA